MSAKIRGIAHASAANGTGTPLTVASQTGDTAVLIASAQLAAPASLYKAPDGWEGTAASPIPGTNRSGYIAHREVTDPSPMCGPTHRAVAWCGWQAWARCLGRVGRSRSQPCPSKGPTATR